MKILYRVTKCNASHCYVTFFVNGQNAGEVVFKPSEWLLFSTAQLLAKNYMKEHYELVFEDNLFTEFQATQL